jgi:hypothetical protein
MSVELIELTGTLVLCIFLALCVLLLPKIFRNGLMQRLATEYGLSYTKTTRPGFWMSLQHPFRNLYKRDLWQENIIAGIVRGHQVKIFDSCQIAGIQAQSTHKRTYLIIDDVSKEIVGTFGITSVSHIKKLIEEL